MKYAQLSGPCFVECRKERVKKGNVTGREMQACGVVVEVILELLLFRFPYGIFTLLQKHFRVGWLDALLAAERFCKFFRTWENQSHISCRYPFGREQETHARNQGIDRQQKQQNFSSRHN